VLAAAAAASLLCSAMGCAQLPFGHQSDSDTVSATAAPVPIAGTAVTESNTAPLPLSSTTGILVQTTTMPGAGSDVRTDPHKVVSPVVLATPSAPVQGGTVVPAMVTAPVTTIPVGASGVVSAEMNKFVFHSAAERARYEQAAARFPDFCHDWQRMLHDRETNNLQHLTWQTRDGVQTSTYTGYGPVETCETKESVEGVPIGKISYEEMIYYLAGKNADDARHAAPKLVHETHTLEIFSWEKDKWFY
jgi:hypothetical protein